MQKPQLEIVCLICGKGMTPQEDTCVDENGKVVHTDCHAQQILRDNSSLYRTDA
jgi:predicted nucleic acid-binding Zn ribbon protein